MINHMKKIIILLLALTLLLTACAEKQPESPAVKPVAPDMSTVPVTPAEQNPNDAPPIPEGAEDQIIQIRPGGTDSSAAAFPPEAGSVVLPAEEYDDNTASIWGITLEVKDVKPDGLTLIMQQSGGSHSGELETGSDFVLYEKKGDSWEKVPYIFDGDVSWTSIAYMVKMGTSTEIPLNWANFYGELPSGTYRLSKNFMDFRGPGDFDSAKAFVEFDI